MKVAAAGLVLIIVAISILPLASAQSPQLSNKVYAFSSQSGSKQSLFLEGNQSGMEMFRNWSLVIEGQGHYEVIENGTVLSKGYSSSSMVIPERFNQSHVSVSVFLNGVKYSFDNITIVNFLSSKSLISVSVSSYMPHQSIDHLYSDILGSRMPESKCLGRLAICNIIVGPSVFLDAGIIAE